MKFELVLPCYNESRNLKALVERASAAAIETGFDPKSFQLILVENGSRDDSETTMKNLKATALGEWFRIVKVHENKGYGFGVWQGLQQTQAPVVAWSHADQQCDPKDAFKAYAILQSKSDKPKLLIKGDRYGRDPKDQFVSWIFRILARLLLGFPFSEINAQPKVFRRDLLQQIQNPPNHFGFDLYVLHRAFLAGWQFESISVLFPPRMHGVSNWAGTFFSRYRTILNMIHYMWTLRRSE